MTNFVKPQGINFSSDSLTARALSTALGRVVSFLQDQEPHGAELNKYEDWWEHDGLHFDKEKIKFHDLFQCIESPRALLKAMPGDDNVFIGIASSGGHWYLRFYVAWTDEGDELIGRFDVTLPYSLSAVFREISPTYNLHLSDEDAVTFYSNLLR